MKLMDVWNDTSGGSLGRIMEANRRRKLKAATDAYYRDVRAEVLQILLAGVPRTEDMKQHMKTCQALADDLLAFTQETNTTKTKQDNRSAAS